MKNQKFAEKLRSERRRLDYTQKQVAEMLNKTQSAYSRIESGVTKPSADELQAISNTLAAAGFADLPPVQIEETPDTTTVRIKWPWNKRWLYVILVLLTILLFDYVWEIPAEISQGFSDKQAGKPDPSPTKTIIASFMLVGGVIYGLYLFIKWLLSKKS